MAVRSATISLLGGGVTRVDWSGLLVNDTGEPVAIPYSADKSWHVDGTVGAGGVARPRGARSSVIDSANDPILTDVFGVVVPGTPDTIKQIMENPVFVYPHVSAGDGSTNLLVVMICVPRP